MIPAGCELDILRRLAEMPFLDRLGLVAFCRRSRSAVYGSMDRLAERGMVQAILHASELSRPSRRYCLTASGLVRLAELEGVSLDDLLSSRPVSGRWQRVLLERLDALAITYRTVSSFPLAERPLSLQWHRSGALDAGITLPGGRTLAVVRMGNAADRTAFAKRLWRLSQEARPGAVLLLAPDEVRLRQVSRMLDNLPLIGFIALESDAARADTGSLIWQGPAYPVPLSLAEVLACVPDGGELPSVSTAQRESAPDDLRLDLPDGDVPRHLLPVLLKPAEKRLLDLLHDWPWLTPAHGGELLGVNHSRVYQVSERLKSQGLALAVRSGGKRCLVLSDSGLAFLARRDRAAVGVAHRRWSTSPLDPGDGLDWRNVRGSRSRQLLRNLDHTQAVHWFLAEIASQSRCLGYRLARFDPPRRAARFFRYEDRLHSVRPDAFGVVEWDGMQRPFFLEWERRAVRPTTMAARIAPYLRYYAASRPLDDHGSIPAVLVVFEDHIAASHFVRVADNEMRRKGVRVPLWVSHRAALEESGPLGAAWQRPGSFHPDHAF